MADDTYEHLLRCKAVELHRKGLGVRTILARTGRSRGWLAKWLQRFRAEGWVGLRARSRAPHRWPRAVSARMVARVLTVHAELGSPRRRAGRFAGRGAEAVRLELESRRVRPLPALRTVERLLQRHGATRRDPPPRSGGGEPYPAPRAHRPGDLHETDLVGPRHLRGPRGVTRFYTVHTVAVVGRGAATRQGRHKTAAFLCDHFVRAWRELGVPRVSQIDNEMAATGGGRHPGALSVVIRLHLLVGAHLVFIPPGEPGRNAHVESFNALWQARVLRHPCPDLRALRRTAGAFLRYYHLRKPHRALRAAADGTRLPGPWLVRHRRHLRPLPSRFALAGYRDARGHVRLPLARGRVSFIRKVDAHGRIEIPGLAYFVGKRLTGRYVTATLFTHRAEVVVKQGGRIHKRFPFPIGEPMVAPWLPLAPGRI